MEKSESISTLVAATINVMKEVKGIDKTMVIGVGNNSYKGVPDQGVKKIIGDAMAKNGLAIFPISINESKQIDSWDETYNGNIKRKQSVFTTVKTTYLLTHESGEFLTVEGLGHGIDSQDKGAGKATTYALKYALLYIFLVPTGKIDDSDNTHSDDIQTPTKQNASHPIKTPDKKEEKTSAEIEKMLIQAVATMDTADSLEKVKAIWSNLKELQLNPVFIKAKDEAKKRLTPKTN